MGIVNQLKTWGGHHLVAWFLMESFSPEEKKVINLKSIIGFDPSTHQTCTGVKPQSMYNTISRKKWLTICFPPQRGWNEFPAERFESIESKTMT